jgi:hypothetical protein
MIRPAQWSVWCSEGDLPAGELQQQRKDDESTIRLTGPQMEPDYPLGIARKSFEGDHGTQRDQAPADGMRDEARSHPGRRSNT